MDHIKTEAMGMHDNDGSMSIGFSNNITVVTSKNTIEPKIFLTMATPPPITLTSSIIKSKLDRSLPANEGVLEDSVVNSTSGQFVSISNTSNLDSTTSSLSNILHHSSLSMNKPSTNIVSTSISNFKSNTSSIRRPRHKPAERKELLELAVNDVLCSQISMRRAAQKYNLAKSSLCDYVRKNGIVLPNYRLKTSYGTSNSHDHNNLSSSSITISSPTTSISTTNYHLNDKRANCANLSWKKHSNVCKRTGSEFIPDQVFNLEENNNLTENRINSPFGRLGTNTNLLRLSSSLINGENSNLLSSFNNYSENSIGRNASEGPGDSSSMHSLIMDNLNVFDNDLLNIYGKAHLRPSHSRYLAQSSSTPSVVCSSCPTSADHVLPSKAPRLESPWHNAANLPTQVPMRSWVQPAISQSSDSTTLTPISTMNTATSAALMMMNLQMHLNDLGQQQQQQQQRMFQTNPLANITSSLLANQHYLRTLTENANDWFKDFAVKNCPVPFIKSVNEKDLSSLTLNDQMSNNNDSTNFVQKSKYKKLNELDLGLVVGDECNQNGENNNSPTSSTTNNFSIFTTEAKQCFKDFSKNICCGFTNNSNINNTMMNTTATITNSISNNYLFGIDQLNNTDGANMQVCLTSLNVELSILCLMVRMNCGLRLMMILLLLW